MRSSRPLLRRRSGSWCIVSRLFLPPLAPSPSLAVDRPPLLRPVPPARKVVFAAAAVAAAAVAASAPGGDRSRADDGASGELASSSLEPPLLLSLSLSLSPETYRPSSPVDRPSASARLGPGLSRVVEFLLLLPPTWRAHRRQRRRGGGERRARLRSSSDSGREGRVEGEEEGERGSAMGLVRSLARSTTLSAGRAARGRCYPHRRLSCPSRERSLARSLARYVSVLPSRSLC